MPQLAEPYEEQGARWEKSFSFISKWAYLDCEHPRWKGAEIKQAEDLEWGKVPLWVGVRSVWQLDLASSKKLLNGIYSCQLGSRGQLRVSVQWLNTRNAFLSIVGYTGHEEPVSKNQVVSTNFAVWWNQSLKNVSEHRELNNGHRKLAG